MARARSWCFTINNYTDEDEEAIRLLADKSRYMIVGKEKGEDGTPHYQGYVTMLDPISFTSMKKKLTRAHLEVARGTAAANRVYCTKENDILIEYGTCPTPGKRTDLEQVRDFLDQGGNLVGVTKISTSYQSVKFAELYLKYNEPERDWKPEVRWYCGSTGSGKTHSAREWLADDIYTSMCTSKWFDGYDGHSSLLIDDFRKSYCSFSTLLRLLDRYPYRLETKGGTRQLLARKIAITSPYHPNVVYDTREDVGQLLRRIDEIILLGDPVLPKKFDFSFDVLE